MDEILDAPVDIHGWQPANYGHEHHGNVTLADAFADSLNDATVRLSQQVGIGQVIAAARDLGLHAPLENNPSLALGTSEVTLLDLTAAYAAVRAGKTPVTPWGISAIKTQDDPNYVSADGSDGSQHSLGQYQGELVKLLQGVVDHGTGHAAKLEGFDGRQDGNDPGLQGRLVYRLRRFPHHRRLGRQRRSQSDEGRGRRFLAGDDLEILHGAGRRADDGKSGSNNTPASANIVGRYLRICGTKSRACAA